MYINKILKKITINIIGLIFWKYIFLNLKKLNQELNVYQIFKYSKFFSIINKKGMNCSSKNVLKFDTLWLTIIRSEYISLKLFHRKKIIKLKVFEHF